MAHMCRKQNIALSGTNRILSLLQGCFLIKNCNCQECHQDDFQANVFAQSYHSKASSSQKALEAHCFAAAVTVNIPNMPHPPHLLSTFQVARKVSGLNSFLNTRIVLKETSTVHIYKVSDFSLYMYRHLVGSKQCLVSMCNSHR